MQCVPGRFIIDKHLHVKHNDFCDGYMRHAFVKIEVKLLLETVSIKKCYFYAWLFQFMVQVKEIYFIKICKQFNHDHLKSLH